MNEKLLQFIWAFGYFNKQQLCTSGGEMIKIINAGEWNTNQGPDFTGARLKIGNTDWAGNVELHILSSDWKTHHHSDDNNYRNVILHVVWDDDGFQLKDVPLLELKGRVSGLLIDRYQTWMNNMAHIPCEQEWIKHGWQRNEDWLQYLIRERLMEKAAQFYESLKKTGNHWGESFWRMLAKNFGYKINTDAFESIAVSLPLTLIGRHKNQIHQLEALLLGQAGLLQGRMKDAYSKLLQREYNFLKTKYHLKPVSIPVQFLRMRPQNFPSLRLAQLAILIQSSAHLFSVLKDETDLTVLKNMFRVTANDYWHQHYRLGEESAFREKMLGETMIESILINTVIPAVYAYGNYHKEQVLVDRSLQWLTEIHAEKNSIVSIYERLGFDSLHSLDTQALQQLKKSYCNQKRCLDCAIGHSFLNGSPAIKKTISEPEVTKSWLDEI
ncbi:DUF2851 family protein [Pollutibacter soli]|uniref:DUF2851 family protein n=1 Tax=Pollutibacter soli TaxID=3034157 RepID=UPI00301328E4